MMVTPPRGPGPVTTTPPFAVAAGSAGMVDLTAEIRRQLAGISACACLGAGPTVRYTWDFPDARGALPKAL